MIRSFRHKGLKLLYETGSRRKVPPARAEQLENVLSVLDVATSMTAIRLPGLHPLQGDRRGHWSVVINGNWRVVFRFDAGDVFDVDFIDYH